MKRKLKGILLVSMFLLAASLSAQGLFMRNVGQVINQQGNAVPEILFTITYQNNSIHFSKNGWDAYSYEYPDSLQIIAHKISCRFEQINQHAYLEEGAKQEYTENYYQNYFEGGVKHAHSVEEFWIRNLYPGIDYHIMIKDGKLKYEFEVDAGADVSQVHWRYDGKDLEQVLRKDGSISVQNAFCGVQEMAPKSYRMDKEHEIASSYTFNENGVWGYRLEGGNRTNYARLIDPYLYWTTFYGGTGRDYFRDIQSDADGNVLALGYTSSTSNVAFQGYQNTFAGGNDVLLAKFSSTGQRLWASYYGGSGNDNGTSLQVYGNGHLFLLASTNSTGLQTRGTKQPINTSDYDMLLMRLNSAGVPLWTEYIGSDTLDSGGSLRVGKDSTSLYIMGYTRKDTVRFNSLQAPVGAISSPSFLLKLDTAGTDIWSQMIGGEPNTNIVDMEIEPNGNVLALFRSTSNNMGTSGSFAPTPKSNSGSYDHLLITYDTAGDVVWATYYGGSGDERYGAICVKEDIIYLTGGTTSSDHIAYNAGNRQSTNSGDWDIYLAKLDTSGQFYWGCYFGGTKVELPTAIGINQKNEIYIAGKGNYPGFFQSVIQDSSNSQYDGILFELDSAGQLNWGSYLGGDKDEDVEAISLQENAVFVTGSTFSSTGIFGSKRSVQPTNGGGYIAGFIVAVIDKLIYSYPEFDTNYCAGSAFKLPYTLADSVAFNNIIRVQFSDSSGSFVNPQTVYMQGRSTAISDSISFTLPTSLKTSNDYRIRLVTSSPADTFLIDQKLRIKQAPSGNIALTGSSILCLGDTVELSWNGNNATQYEWSKDGIPTGDTLPLLRVSSPGKYTMVNGANTGCSSKSNEIQIQAGILPEARIFTEDSVFCLNQYTTNFQDSSKNGFKRQWSVNGNAVDTAILFQYSFVDTGTFQIQLREESNSGCTDSLSMTTRINPVDQAQFLINHTVACENQQAFNFQLLQNQPYMAFEFYLGDSTASILDSFGHVYTNSGIYFPSLRVENQYGCKDTFQKQIEVFEAPVADFILLDSLFCTNLPATRFGNRSKNYTNSRWYFGDGDSSQLTHPTHYFAQGNYQVQLIVESKDNCEDTLSKALQMTAPTKVIIQSSDSIICVGDQALIKTDCDTTLTYFWTGFGTACSLSVGDSLERELVVENRQGCKDTGYAKIQLYDIPNTPVISQSWDTLMVEDDYASYQWFYEGNAIAGGASSRIIATQNGVYRVNVQDGNACSSLSNKYTMTNVGIARASYSGTIHLYPNPNVGQFTVSLIDKNYVIEGLKLRMFNALGQEVSFTMKHRDEDSIDIHISNPIPGIYHLQLIWPERMESIKIQID